MSDWPTPLEGVTETVVTTLTPSGGWNAAALGLHGGSPVTARTWGQTRTRVAFERDGTGVIQFTTDSLTFVRAALTIHEVEEPVLAAADAWVWVEATRTASGSSAGTEWVEWRLDPLASRVRRRRVAGIRRARGAVVEASVAASRLDVEGFDRSELLATIERCGEVVERTGDARDRQAMSIVMETANE